ncbi:MULTISPECIES: LysR family transcriptional regulator [unclassified Enterococcus]|uniref:LysR family transcriptional regulator n=1 Tax=unclassified Enterococcus TaxID=2608891 RepID=UPI00155251A5|nr:MULTISPECIES: LysR family transcriptional regulator [unclassified Enterococcus]MBS7576644.1 LysR family transcriptional regulator [Enterococcus sp. MMGLQ5-2]MBS7583869.1 LysR family transcriptional regulator [Enterococcus sp. MMGLQ5-1]NPD11730.1 LysR family transcriptional regulator [Enterococcus sp. MMGLQ5-1]NPD36481.1 LysR family transcriptional regulator [Enterococcus sp. MMGLQ5-2]
MNIQQMKYVMAIANNGSFREAAKKLFIAQPSLSHAIKELENEIGQKLFDRNKRGAVLTAEGIEFYEKAQIILNNFQDLEDKYLKEEIDEAHFSLASQHYDFLAPIITDLMIKFPSFSEFRIFENTTLKILEEVEHYRSEIGIIYLNATNAPGILRMIEKSKLDYEVITRFQTHVFLGNHHPLAYHKEISIDDLKGLPQVRFTQESNQYLYYSEDLVDTEDEEKVIYTTDRATLNGILERTNAYASGSGLIDQHSRHQIVVVPLKDSDMNELVLLKHKNKKLSEIAENFVTLLKHYFENGKF